ncbi:MAG: Hsp70 family protein, partial [Thermotogota bacterium]
LTTILSKITGTAPVLIEEPLGALYYHIIRKDINKEDGRGGVLVVDFGGGTLDLAYVKNFKIQKVWGSPIIGGVLFDDLFYNIFLEQNHRVKSLVEKEGISSYLRTVLFKNLKEKYSVLHATSERTQMKENIVFGKSSFGTFIIPDFDYLYDKMTNYQMSDELKQDLKGSDYLDELGDNANIDLPKVISNQVLRGQREFEIRPDSISLIILTGGSSRWKFFVDMIEQEYPYTRILASADPESTISRGLGLCYSAKLYEKKVRVELSAHKAELTKRLEESYKIIFKKGLHKHSQAVYTIYSLVVKEVLDKFLENGGSIRELEKQMRLAFIDKQPELDQLNLGFLKIINHQIEEKTKEELSRWFSRSLINYEFLKKSIIPSKKFEGTSYDMSLLNNVIYNRIMGISSLIVGIVSGSILGGSGIALMASGALGWLGGFIGGVVIAVASSMGLKKPLTERMKAIPTPKWVLRILLVSKKRLVKKAQLKLHKDLKQSEQMVFETFLKLLEENDKKLDRLIDEQIQEISYSNIVDVYD